MWYDKIFWILTDSVQKVLYLHKNFLQLQIDADFLFLKEHQFVIDLKMGRFSMKTILIVTASCWYALEFPKKYMPLQDL